MKENLKSLLRTDFSAKEIEHLVRGYDVVGDIVIIVIPDALIHRRSDIGAAILNSGKNIRLVARRAGCYSGEFRTLELERIGGEGRLETLHKEFGIRLHVDVEKVYFSPRSGAERFRVAGQVKAGERVLVMFSGIGPLALMMAVHTQAVEVIGVEKNREAHGLALKNKKVNKRAQNVHFLEGDVSDVLPKIQGRFDRIAMPLPHSVEEYVPLALSKLRPGGTLHYYDFRPGDEFAQAEETLRGLCKRENRQLVNSEVHRCGHVSPRKFRICVDAVVR